MVDVGKFTKILRHPQKDYILSELLSGTSPEKVSEFLSVKYSGDKSRIVGKSLLREFRDDHLDQYKFLKKVIKGSAEYDRNLAESLLKNDVWKTRLASFVDDELDIKKKTVDLIKIVESRVEQVFDKIQQDPGNYKGDYVLIKWFELLFNALEKLDKFVNGAGDTIIQNNITVQMVEQHSLAFQKAITEVLTEFDPVISTQFLDLLATKLQTLAPPQIEAPVQHNLTIEEKRKELNKVIATFEDEENEED